MRRLALVIHNVRSAHNVGSLLRTADGLGVAAVFLTGYTPYPQHEQDNRLPHISQKVSAAIHKTALGAEQSINWQQVNSLNQVLAQLVTAGYTIVALEQTAKAANLTNFKSKQAIALVVGNEVEGLDEQTLNMIERHLKIPMLGQKESLNVAVAGAIALYHLRHLDKHTAKV
jgi:tRNA G18 (ribose-2'-O)-methylase SpoU